MMAHHTLAALRSKLVRAHGRERAEAFLARNRGHVDALVRDVAPPVGASLPSVRHRSGPGDATTRTRLNAPGEGIGGELERELLAAFRNVAELPRAPMSSPEVDVDRDGYKGVGFADTRSVFVDVRTEEVDALLVVFDRGRTVALRFVPSPLISDVRSRLVSDEADVDFSVGQLAVLALVLDLGWVNDPVFESDAQRVLAEQAIERIEITLEPFAVKGSFQQSLSSDGYRDVDFNDETTTIELQFVRENMVAVDRVVDLGRRRLDRFSFSVPAHRAISEAVDAFSMALAGDDSALEITVTVGQLAALAALVDAGWLEEPQFNDDGGAETCRTSDNNDSGRIRPRSF